METINTRSNDWHLDRKVPLSIIFALVVWIVTGIVQMSDLRSRVAAVEGTRVETMSIQHERDDRQDSDNREAFTLMRAQLEKMDGKLDRLIESRPAAH